MFQHRASISIFVLTAYLFTVAWGNVTMLCISSDGHIAMEFSWIGCLEADTAPRKTIRGFSGAQENLASDLAKDVPCVDVCLIDAGFSSSSETSKLKVLSALAALPVFFLLIQFLFQRLPTPPPIRVPRPNGTLLQLRTVVLLN